MEQPAPPPSQSGGDYRNPSWIVNWSFRVGAVSPRQDFSEPIKVSGPPLDFNRRVRCQLKGDGVEGPRGGLFRFPVRRENLLESRAVFESSAVLTCHPRSPFSLY